MVHPRPRLIISRVELATIVCHSVLDGKVRQVFPRLFVFVDLLAAEEGLLTEEQVRILRLLEAKFHFEIIVKLPFTIEFSVYARGVRAQVLRLIADPLHVVTGNEAFKTIVASPGWGCWTPILDTLIHCRPLLLFDRTVIVVAARETACSMVEARRIGFARAPSLRVVLQLGDHSVLNLAHGYISVVPLSLPGDHFIRRWPPSLRVALQLGDHSVLDLAHGFVSEVSLSLPSDHFIRRWPPQVVLAGPFERVERPRLG